MGFYNIMLEGEQAEEYKKRKSEEAKKAEESIINNDRRAGYIQRTRDVKKGTLVDTDPTRVKNGIHNVYNRGEHDEISKEINTPRSGYTNSVVKQETDIDKHYWDDNHRDGAVHKYQSQTIYSPSKEDKARDKAAQKVAKRATKPGLFPDIDKQRETDIARDAVNRHMRRHPDQWDGDKRIKTRSESGIFESIEFLND